MWLFLLLPWLFSISIAEYEKVSSLRVATADVLRVKCDAIPYRTYIEGNICYFAVKADVKHDVGDIACRNGLRSSKMYLDSARERVLRVMMLDPSEYHDIQSSGTSKNVLCSYESQYSCEQGDVSLPGKCLIRSLAPLTWPETRTFCISSGGSSAVTIHNDDENMIVAGFLEKSEAGWLLPGHKFFTQKWSARPDSGAEQNIDFWSWFAEDLDNLKCGGDQQAVITRNGKNKCTAYGQWKVDDVKNRNIALCVKDATCPFCPPPKVRDVPVEVVTVPEIVIPTPAPVKGPPKPCLPLNDPPHQQDLWDLKYYYNFGRILHGFAATPEGYRTMQSQGIGYSGSAGSGSMGGTISDAGYARINEYCSDPEEKKHIKKMWFGKQGQSYTHAFEEGWTKNVPKHIYVGYVATKVNACGSKWPVKRWSCLVSADMMYAGNLNGNTWYRNRQQNGGVVHFWLWETIQAVREKQRVGKPKECNSPPPVLPLPAVNCKPRNDPPKQNDLWDLKYYYNFGRILHAFAATPAGYNKIQSNGIGYSGSSGSGSMGGTLSDDGFTRLPDYCSNPEERKHIKKMWFGKQGQSYHHVFEEGPTKGFPRDVYVGYVSTKIGACGSKWPVKRWSCLVSADMMYAGNLNSNTWYRGREQNGGAVHFYLWEMNQAVREQQRTGKC